MILESLMLIRMRSNGKDDNSDGDKDDKIDDEDSDGGKGTTQQQQ